MKELEEIAARLLAAHRGEAIDWSRVPKDERDRWVGVAQTAKSAVAASPVPMRLHCPECGGLHLDEGEFATKPHHTHACQHCGACWRPAVANTVGVRFLPGFKSPPVEAHGVTPIEAGTYEAKCVSSTLTGAGERTDTFELPEGRRVTFHTRSKL